MQLSKVHLRSTVAVLTGSKKNIYQKVFSIISQNSRKRMGDEIWPKMELKGYICYIFAILFCESKSDHL